MSSPPLADTVDRSRIPADVLEVCRRLQAARYEAFLVGGGIRDLLLGREPADFDVATSARPEQVLAVFGAAFTVPTGVQHGTVTVLTVPKPPGSVPGPRRHVEVTTFRGEGAYADGRRPSSVCYVGTIEEDLSRRDFTMNAVAYDPLADRIADPFDGRGDLARRLIRAVGDPLERFGEDGLRPLRAVRQAAQLGFAIDPATLAAIPRTLHVVRRVSAERVRDEMMKLLASPRPSVGIEQMRVSGLLAELLPELLETVGVEQNPFHAHDVYQHTLRAVDHAPPDPLLRLAALLHDIGKPRTRAPRAESREGGAGEGEGRTDATFYRHEVVGAEMADAICRRWKMASAERERVVALVVNHMFFYTPEWSDGSVRRFVRRIGPELLPALFALREADVNARGRGEEPEGETAELRRRIAEVAAEDAVLGVRDLAIDGRDVMRLLGLPPGPRVGQTLERLLERVLDDPSLNTRERLEALLPEVT